MGSEPAEPGSTIEQAADGSAPDARSCPAAEHDRATGVTLLGGATIMLGVGATKQAAALTVASAQRQRINRTQLTACGWTRKAIEHGVGVGWLRRVAPGVYAVGAGRTEPLTRETEILLNVGLDAVLAGQAVLRARGLLTGSADQMEVMCPRRLIKRTGVRLLGAGTFDECDITRAERLPMTTVERALLDAAPSLAADRIDAIFDDAVWRSMTSRTKLRELLERQPRHPGTGRLAHLLDPDRRSQPTESGLQRAALRLIRRSGLPEPSTEVNLLDLRFRADIYWPEARLAVEVDHYRYHGSLRRSFNRDRVKDRAFADHGIATVRWSDEDIEQRDVEIVAQLVRRYERRVTALGLERPGAEPA